MGSARIKLSGIFTLLCFMLLGATGWILWKNCSQETCSFIKQYHSDILIKFTEILPKVALILILFILFKIAYMVLVEFFLRRVLKNFNAHDSFVGILRIIHFIWWAFYSIVSLSILVGDLGALLTSLGLIGFGLTFALQKPIMNFIGWVTIILNKVYKEGDRIEVGSVRGDVKKINLMNTELEGLLETSEIPSNKIVTFPNEMVLTSEVQNYTKDSNYILEELSIGITYESNFKKAIEGLNEIIVSQIKANRSKYFRQKSSRIDEFIAFDSLFSKLRLSDKNKKEQLKKLKKQEEQKYSDIESEFHPKIRVEFLDSAIELVAQFLTPYNDIKANRTAINLAFLEFCKKHKDVEIAYPHMQIVK